MAKAAARQFLVTIEAFPNTRFSGKSGGEVTSETSKVYDGGSTVPHVLTSPPDIGDITITGNYDPDLDQETLLAAITMVGQLVTTVTVIPLYGDMSRTGAKPFVYSDCTLTGVTPPEHDAGSGDAATFELTFAAASVS